MGEIELVRLMNPMVSLVFAFTFFVLWSRQRHNLYILAFAIAFFMSACGYVLAQFVFDKLSVGSALISSAFYVFAIFTVVLASCKRIGETAPTKTLIFIGTAGIAATVWATLNFEIINFRITMFNTTLGLMFTIGAMALRHRARSGGAELLLFCVFAFVGAELLVVPQITLTFDGPMMIAQYESSLHFAVLGLATSVSLLVLALALIAVCVSDSIGEMKVSAETDPLTGLKIRNAFERLSLEAIKQAHEHDYPVSMILADIDSFKSINDSFGHQTGDAVIAKFGMLLQSAVRDSDVVGRVGGEEFCILLNNTPPKQARKIAIDLCRCFSAMRIRELPRHRSCTASFGVTTLKRRDDYISLFGRADKALYAAKEGGRNQVCESGREVEARQMNKIASVLRSEIAQV